MKKWSIKLVEKEEKGLDKALTVAYLKSIRKGEPEQFNHLLHIIKEVVNG